MTKLHISCVAALLRASLIALLWLAVVYPGNAQTVAIDRNDADQPRKVRVNGVELNYLDRGQGIPVVFVHGGLDDYRYWRSQMKQFSERYRVIAYSRRYNFPNNNSLSRSDHSAIVEAGDLAALIESLKLGRVHIVGASYGAYTALFLALKHPEVVRTLTLAEAPVLRLAQHKPQGRALYQEFLADLWQPAGAAFRRRDKEQALRVSVEYFAGKGALEQAPEEVQHGWRDNLREWEALTTSSDAFPNISPRYLKTLNTPTLMLSGERTLKILKFVDAELRPLLSAERIIIPGASHDMWSEYPDLCGQATLAFLARH
ncbi:MAG TPA: alpha/beta hydrolase [Pyrinomonadaceae bacterium]|nr:alpha/beta hydrolase [Pyrinomonadaceae bacterium]